MKKKDLRKAGTEKKNKENEKEKRKGRKTKKGRKEREKIQTMTSIFPNENIEASQKKRGKKDQR